MRCPFCGEEDTQVKDSRASEDGAAIRRRRLCTSCGSRFTTFERIQLRDLIVIKRNGKKVPFDRDKLSKSLIMALRKRQTDENLIERAINGIVRQLESEGDNEISSPLLEQDRQGNQSYKLIMVSDRFDEHVADYSKDYIKIKELALKEKQLTAIQKWMNEKIIDTYISVNDQNKQCNFANKWLKN